MATLYISEFQTVQFHGQVPHQPSDRDQIVAIELSANLSLPLLERTILVLLHCDATCSIKFTPTTDPSEATTSNMRMEAGQTVPFGVAPGFSVSVIANI